MGGPQNSELCWRTFDWYTDERYLMFVTFWMEMILDERERGRRLPSALNVILPEWLHSAVFTAALMYDYRTRRMMTYPFVVGSAAACRPPLSMLHRLLGMIVSTRWDQCSSTLPPHFSTWNVGLLPHWGKSELQEFCAMVISYPDGWFTFHCHRRWFIQWFVLLQSPPSFRFRQSFMVFLGNQEVWSSRFARIAALPLRFKKRQTTQLMR